MDNIMVGRKFPAFITFKDEQNKDKALEYLLKKELKQDTDFKQEQTKIKFVDESSRDNAVAIISEASFEDKVQAIMKTGKSRESAEKIAGAMVQKMKEKGTHEAINKDEKMPEDKKRKYIQMLKDAIGNFWNYQDRFNNLVAMLQRYDGDWDELYDQTKKIQKCTKDVSGIFRDVEDFINKKSENKEIEEKVEGSTGEKLKSLLSDLPPFKKWSDDNWSILGNELKMNGSTAAIFSGAIRQFVEAHVNGAKFPMTTEAWKVYFKKTSKGKYDAVKTLEIFQHANLIDEITLPAKDIVAGKVLATKQEKEIAKNANPKQNMVVWYYSPEFKSGAGKLFKKLANVKMETNQAEGKLDIDVEAFDKKEAKGGGQLMGSAPSLEALEDLIKKKMYWNTVIFEPIGKNEWSVASGKGVIDTLRVVLKGGRYRLERKPDMETKQMGSSDIKVSGKNDVIQILKNVKIRKNKKGWSVAEKDGKYYISKDGNVYIQVGRGHPAVKMETKQKDVNEVNFSNREKDALKIVYDALRKGKHGPYAVYRQGVGTTYYRSEREAKEYLEKIKKKVGRNAIAQILTKNDPIFKQAGIVEVDNKDGAQNMESEQMNEENFNKNKWVSFAKETIKRDEPHLVNKLNFNDFGDLMGKVYKASKDIESVLWSGANPQGTEDRTWVRVWAYMSGAKKEYKNVLTGLDGHHANRIYGQFKSAGMRDQKQFSEAESEIQEQDKDFNPMEIGKEVLADLKKFGWKEYRDFRDGPQGNDSNQILYVATKEINTKNMLGYNKTALIMISFDMKRKVARLKAEFESEGRNILANAIVTYKKGVVKNFLKYIDKIIEKNWLTISAKKESEPEIKEANIEINTPLQLVKHPFKSYTGVTWPKEHVDAYNKEVEKINKFIEAGRPIPQNILNGMHNLFMMFSDPSLESEQIKEQDKNLDMKIQGISKLLKQLGFDTASKDVNADNINTYAQWVANEFKSKIKTTDPITRKVFINYKIADMYKEVVSLLKKLGFNIKESSNVQKAQEAVTTDVSGNDIRQKIKDFFVANPNPDDGKIHALSDQLGINTHEFEAIIYSMLSDLISPNKNEDTIPGGKSDGRPDSDFDPEQLKMGIEVEKEHTNDPELAKEIAKDHLSEIPDYYTRLKNMEKNAGLKEGEQVEAISSSQRKEFVEYAAEILSKLQKSFKNAKPLQLKATLRTVFNAMTLDWDNPNYKNAKVYMPDKFNSDLFDNAGGNKYDSVWMKMKDAEHDTIFRQAMKAAGIEESQLKEAQPKQAVWSKKFKTLTYFDSRNTSKTINCDSLERAKKIIELSKVDQKLTVESLKNVETTVGPGGHIPDQSGPPSHGKGQGPGNGAQDGSGIENADIAIENNKYKLPHGKFLSKPPYQVDKKLLIDALRSNKNLKFKNDMMPVIGVHLDGKAIGVRYYSEKDLDRIISRGYDDLGRDGKWYPLLVLDVGPMENIQRESRCVNHKTRLENIKKLVESIKGYVS